MKLRQRFEIFKKETQILCLRDLARAINKTLSRQQRHDDLLDSIQQGSTIINFTRARKEGRIISIQVSFQEETSKTYFSVSVSSGFLEYMTRVKIEHANGLYEEYQVALQGVGLKRRIVLSKRLRPGIQFQAVEDSEELSQILEKFQELKQKTKVFLQRIQPSLRD